MDVVIHFDTNNTGLTGKLARRCDQLMRSGLRVVVVVTDEGIGALKAPFDNHIATLHQLVANGLTVVICTAGAQARAVRPEELPPFCRWTPSGVVEVVRLQKQGAAYLGVADSHYA